MILKQFSQNLISLVSGDTTAICYRIAKMFKLVSLFIAAALVSLQSAYIVSAQIDNPKNDLDNNLQINRKFYLTYCITSNYLLNYSQIS